MRARQRVSFGFDLGLIWASRANVAGEQLSREHLSGEHLSWNPKLDSINILFNYINFFLVLDFFLGPAPRLSFLVVPASPFATRALVLVIGHGNCHSAAWALGLLTSSVIADLEFLVATFAQERNGHGGTPT